MSGHFSRLCLWLSALSLGLLLSLSGSAQTPGNAPPAKAKAGPEACDGALDIVPSKSATFMRKRRAPGKKPAAKTELKPENKSSR